MVQVRDLLDDPEFDQLSTGAKAYVFGQVSQRDDEYQALTPEGRSQVRQRVLGAMRAMGMPTTPAGTPERSRELEEMSPFDPTPPPLNVRTIAEGIGSTAMNLAMPGSTTWGGLALRAIGSGLGAAAGSLAAEPVEPTESPGTTAAISGATGVLGDLVGGAATKVGQRLFPARPMARGAPEAKQVTEYLGERLSPAQQTESRALDIAETMAEASLLGGTSLRRMKETAKQKLQATVERLSGNFASRLSPEEAGVAIQDALEGKETAWKRVAHGMYKALDDALTTDLGQTHVIVDLKPLKQAAQNMRRGKVTLESEYLNNKIDEILAMPDAVRFEEAHELRSSMMDITRAINAPGAPVTGGHLKAKGPINRMTQLVHQAMEEGANAAGGNVKQVWRDADEFWREGAKLFNLAVVRQIARSSPDTVVSAIAKANHPYVIRTIRQSLKDSPEAWRAVQGTWLSRTMGKPSITDPTTQTINGRALLNELTNFGDEALSELFPGGAMGNLKRVAQALSFAQRKPTSDFSVAAKYGQYGALGLLANDLLRGSLNPAIWGTSGLVLLGPVALGAALTNPRIADLFVQGIRLPANAPHSAALVTRLGALLAKEGLIGESQESQE